ncbi:MAG: CHAT domain-containing protein, partial [Deltaproteobacteria bacterium]
SGMALLTLSACDTGRGTEVTGQGVLGLQAAVMAAGARGLLMSLWPVPDESTRLLMTHFYEDVWEGGLSPRTALLAAQRAVRDDPSRKFTHPLHWAGWVLVGDPGRAR